MSYWGTAWIFGSRIFLIRILLLWFAVILLVRRELVLSLNLQFELGAFQLVLEADDFAEQFAVAFLEHPNLSKRRFPRVFTEIGNVSDMDYRSTAKMWAMSHIGASMFVLRIDWKRYKKATLGCLQPNPKPQNRPTAV